MKTENTAPPASTSAAEHQRTPWQKPEVTKITAGSAQATGGSGADNDVFS